VIRTQIQLTEEQARALRKRAADEGRSMADLVRDGVDRLLVDRGVQDKEAAKRRSIDALGRFRSGMTDLGSAHDRHLGDAIDER
jgi:plasmid stability protein